MVSKMFKVSLSVWVTRTLLGLLSQNDTRLKNRHQASYNKPRNRAILGCKHTERQAAVAAADLHWVYGDAWEWVWDRFWSVTIHSNGTLPLPLMLDMPLDARCEHSLIVQSNMYSIF